MKIDVRLFAGLKCENQKLPCFGEREFYLNTPDGITIQELCEMLKLKEMPLVIIADGIVVKKDYMLADNQRVGIFPPVAGG